MCDDCWNAIPLLTRIHPLYQETRTRLCSEGSIDDLVSCYVFEKDGPFQHVAHALKYEEYKSFGVQLGKQLGAMVLLWNLAPDIIIPVPLHQVKFRERSYNQSEIIAQGVASILHKPVFGDAIRRTRDTQTQTKLNREERKINMKHAFQVRPEAVEKLRGKSCLLVDDVITTGATTHSCAQEMLSAGVHRVIAGSAALAC